MNEDLKDILIDTQKEYRKSNKIKNRIIIFLICLLFGQAVSFTWTFAWYESQFEVVDTEQTKEGTNVNLNTNGNNANAEYNDNDVQGNQYNGNAVHNEQQ